jgi:hypothetical protein
LQRCAVEDAVVGGESPPVTDHCFPEPFALFAVNALEVADRGRVDRRQELVERFRRLVGAVVRADSRLEVEVPVEEFVRALGRGLLVRGAAATGTIRGPSRRPVWTSTAFSAGTAILPRTTMVRSTSGPCMGRTDVIYRAHRSVGS